MESVERIVRNLIFVALLLAGSVHTAFAQTGGTYGHDAEVGETFIMSLGGKLYDDVFTMTGTNPPETPNPLYPTYINPDGLGTWRCVACHGWDYRGADGERAKVAKSRVFRNLTHLTGVDPKTVRQRLARAHPGYFDRISAKQAPDFIALFLSGGQYQRETLLNSTGRGTGSAPAGQSIFEGACANCHQLDGRAFLRGEQGDKSSLGWVSRNRPEQVLHKIMNGFPATDMLAVRFLDMAHIADLLTYMQSLDKEQN